MNFLKTLSRSMRVGQKNIFTIHPRLANKKKLLFKPESSIETDVMDFLEKYKDPKASQWKNLRTDLLSQSWRLNEANIDATILGFCLSGKKLQAARGFVEFLDASSDIPSANSATVARLMRVYHAVGCERSLTSTEEEEIIVLYEKLKKKHPVFDGNTAEGAIAGLSITHRWQECLKLLENIKIMCKPSIVAYTCTISAAFRNGEKDVAIRTFSQSLRDTRIPKCSALTDWIGFCSRENERIDEFLYFISRNELQMSQRVIEKLQSHLNAKGIKSWKTTIDPHGTCTTCNNKLSPVQLSDEEFHKLQSKFLESVLIREDVFLKSNPKEVAAFKTFLMQHKPFDCIVDGLNVALSKGTGRSTEIQAKNLLNVVRHFSRKGQKVLVLGRAHMSRWPREQLAILKEQAKMFLTDNLSQDDPFLLYAAIISGKNCRIVSKDLMRSHAFLLGSEELRGIFRRWQHAHQFRLEYSPGTAVTFQAPPTFSVTAHRVNEQWHVPFQQDYSPHQLDLFEIPQQWLCFSLPNKRGKPKC